jgi:hypothetical protein
MIHDELESDRLLNQVYGRQVGPRWNQARFVTSGGTRVIEASPKTQVRGLLDKGRRWTKIGSNPTKVCKVA